MLTGFSGCRLRVPKPWQQLHIEHVVFENLEKPEITIRIHTLQSLWENHWSIGNKVSRWHHHGIRRTSSVLSKRATSVPFQSSDGCGVVLVSIASAALLDVATQMALPPDVEVVDNNMVDG